jgi:hypothetical protein
MLPRSRPCGGGNGTLQGGDITDYDGRPPAVSICPPIEPLNRAAAASGTMRHPVRTSASLSSFGSSRLRGRAAVRLMLIVLAATAGAAEQGWQDADDRDGIALQWRPATADYRAYRGSIAVCTDLYELQRFVGDAEQLTAWVPYTEAARSLPADPGRQLYYLRTSAPWPFKSRDMVYELIPQEAKGSGLVLELEGRPEALPEQRGAVRMRSSAGRWTFEPAGAAIRVTLELTADPQAPAFYANRRLAATVAGALQNLAERFSCTEDPPP